MIHVNNRRARILVIAILLALLAGCSQHRDVNDDRATKRDKTKKGAAIGAASGAVLGAVLGEGELDEILAGAAIGAGIGAGIGAYMDRQEEKLGQIPGTTVERISEDMILIHFDSDVLFEIDSSKVGVVARHSLDQAASVFNEYPKTAIIAQGHTDATGKETYNQGLSERRAESVMRHLIGRGVDADRITAVGYGEGYPLVSNDTEANRALNRRVDLLLKAKAK